MNPPKDLRCEHFANPIGIDSLLPRFSWKLDSDKKGACQTAYRIRVSSRPGGDGDLWDSARVESSQSVDVEYAGVRLVSRLRGWWTVQVWDENGQEVEPSTEAVFEMGLLEPEDWQAKWIGGDLVGGPRTSVPLPYLRKTASLSGVKSARLYVTALGLYEFRINGRRVGDCELAPGWTDYRKRIQYQVCEVAGLLLEGENALSAVLGDGWYCGNVEWRGRQLYGDRPKLLAQLEVEHEDGARTTVVSDGTWQHTYGPLLEADLLMGESYDARLELGAWRPAIELPGPAGKLVAMRGPAVKVIRELAPIDDPVERPKWPRPDFIFDMGQNMVGRARLKVSGPAGTTVRLRFAEMLTPSGDLYTENLRSAKQTDYYTLKGEGDEVWEPKFTFHGFRYVEVSGYPGKPGRDAITGVVLHSDTPLTGSFECNDPVVNQLQHNIEWGQRGNFVDVPTDCPQRDERLGWTGDAQVFVRTAAFNMDVQGFFEKWLNDLQDSQSESGEIPPTAPTTGVVGSDGGPAWADAFVICPWTIYLSYGDKRILEEHYPAMRLWLEQQKRTSRDLIRCYPGYEGFSGFGDWLNIKAETPHELIGTAFFAQCSRLMGKIARLLGRESEAAEYEAQFEQIRVAFQRHFVTPAGVVASGTQTAMILALHFDLLPQELRPAVAQALVDDIGRRGWHLSAGFVGSSYLPWVLMDAGRLDAAYKLLFQKSWPSWLYAVTKGATTIWERWDGWTEEAGFQDPGMNSFNHYAYGAVGAWLYAAVAGIELDPENPGYRHILLRPHPGEGLSWARAELESVYGKIVSDWRVEDGRFHWTVVVPPNATATAFMPAGFAHRSREEALSSGQHEFTLEIADVRESK